MAKARFAAVVLLPSPGEGRGHHQGAGGGVHGGEVDVGPQDAVAFRSGVQALHLRQQVGIGGGKGWDGAERGQAEHTRRLVHRVDAVVQELLHQGQADADEQPDQAGEEDALHPVGPDGRKRDGGALDDAGGGVVGLLAQVEVAQLVGEVLVLLLGRVVFARQAVQGQLQAGVLADVSLGLGQPRGRERALRLERRDLGGEVQDLGAQGLAQGVRAGGLAGRQGRLLGEALLEVGDLGVDRLHLRRVRGQATRLGQADAHILELADIVLEAGDDAVGGLGADGVCGRLPVQQ